MILSSIHAGSLRYYGGRATMRFDLLDEAWLDRAVGWLQQQGRHPYVLVEDWEMPLFTLGVSPAGTPLAISGWHRHSPTARSDPGHGVTSSIRCVPPDLRWSRRRFVIHGHDTRHRHLRRR